MDGTTVHSGYSRSGEFKPIAHAIIQARLGSERLPGKMLMDLGGKPVLAHVIDRLKMCRNLHHIIVASPDKELVQLAYDRGVWGYIDTGDPDNVLLRYIKTAGWAGSQLVVRICGDSPLLDPELVDNTLNAYVESKVDIATNVLRRSYPKGMDVEVLHVNTLKRIYHLQNSPEYREHVTYYTYQNPGLFVFKSIYQNRDYSWLNLSIDTQLDLDKIRYMIINSGYDGTWDHQRIAKWFEETESAYVNGLISEAETRTS